LIRDKRSYLDEILSRHSNLPVTRVEVSTPILPGHIYVLPENSYFICEHNNLLVQPRGPGLINVQEPDTAEHNGMPWTVMESDHPYKVGTITDLVHELLLIINRNYNYSHG